MWIEKTINSKKISHVVRRMNGLKINLSTKKVSIAQQLIKPKKNESLIWSVFKIFHSRMISRLTWDQIAFLIAWKIER